MTSQFFIVFIMATTLLFVGCSPEIQPVTAENGVILHGGGTSTTGGTIDGRTTEGSTDSGDADNGGGTNNPLPTGPTATLIPTPTGELPDTDGGGSTAGDDKPAIVNLKIMFTDSNGTQVSPKGVIADNHSRISCGQTSTTCHTTYFEGTEVILTAPIEAILIRGSTLLRGSLKGWECNGSFQPLEDIAKFNFTFKFTIQNDMDCVPSYSF